MIKGYTVFDQGSPQMRFLRLAVASTSIALTAGCATGPRYVAPSLQVPAKFMSTDAIETRQAPRPIGDLANWWRSFDDPMMADLVERALANNLDLAQARAHVLQARAALKSENASLLPAGGVTGQAGQVYQSLETPIGRLGSAFPGFERSTPIYQTDLGASWELDVFGGGDAARDAARAEWQATEAGATAARLMIAAQTADTYIAVRALQSRLDIARAQVGMQARLTELVAAQYCEGLAAEFEMREAEAGLSRMQATVPELQNQLDIAMDALDVLIAAQPGTVRSELGATVPIPKPPGIATAGGPAALIRRRPDIIAAERRLAATNAQIGAAIAEYYPKFSLHGLLGTATAAAGGLFGSSSVQASGVLGLRWRLFDFARVDAEIAAAKGRNTEALAAYRQTVLRASQDVEDAFSTLLQQEARADTFEMGQEALDRAQSASIAAYKSGAVSRIVVLGANLRLLAMQDNVLQARAAASRAAVQSFRALGGGWASDNAANDIGLLKAYALP